MFATAIGDEAVAYLDREASARHRQDHSDVAKVNVGRTPRRCLRRKAPFSTVNLTGSRGPGLPVDRSRLEPPISSSVASGPGLAGARSNFGLALCPNADRIAPASSDVKAVLRSSDRCCSRASEEASRREAVGRTASATD
jgi:hypothetical protein